MKTSWREVMGQNAIWLEDDNNLSEVIVSAIQLNEGADKADVLKIWSGTTGMVISRALTGVNTSVISTTTDASRKGVRRL